MGRLTDDMIRLCGEISVLRGDRKAFLNELKHDVVGIQIGVASMKAGFRNAHAQMARKMKTERAGFIFNLERTVAGLKNAVAGIRKEFAVDITGARREWSGPSPSERRAREEAERRRMEAERKVAGETEQKRSDTEGSKGLGKEEEKKKARSTLTNRRKTR